MKTMSVSGYNDSLEIINNFLNSGCFRVNEMSVNIATFYGIKFDILDYSLEIDDCDVEIIYKNRALSWKINTIHYVGIYRDGIMIDDEDELTAIMKNISEHGEEIMTNARSNFHNRTTLPGKFVMELLKAIIDFCQKL